MKRIYSVLVENRAGVLCKVAGLFWRRCFNIDSLAVGETDDPKVSNMIIVSSGDGRTLEQIEKQLNKKLDVVKVKTFSQEDSVSRELMMIKVKYTRDNRRDIIENCQLMGAQVIDLSKTMMTIQICDTPERVQIFLNTMKSIRIAEITRTGMLALTKCTDG
ncbi:MAG: acetolactate synthase small subunit [Lachnospiraceae bacterium]|jgi:acetolactate synthase-1/3 small subunit|nr:acetolactate synthase small subunit [Lachnospiraceae bacterium]MCI1726811.1 acetolactate synthase small subunit [Lachnospiraceae bacterium]